VIRRGDIVIVALPGDYGKPRPAVVIQSDRFVSALPTVLLCPLTTEILAAPLVRITVVPTLANGIRATSQIMVDKIHPFRRTKVGEPVGHLEDATLSELNEAIAYMTGLAD
jgi:mRNA interferase MazF